MFFSLLQKWRRAPQHSSTKDATRTKRATLRLVRLETRELLSANLPAATPLLLASGNLTPATILTPRTPDSPLPGSASPASSPILGPLAAQPPSAPGSPSPTGRDPRLLWTPQQQAVWEQMRQQHNPWWQLILHNVQHTPYGDFGAWATLAYQITGNTAYAAQAWSQIAPMITHDPKNANVLRQNFEQLVISFDWLLPALTNYQRNQYVNGLNRWCSWALGNAVPGKGGFRAGDFDQLVGQYFGLALVDLATAGYSPIAGTWLNQTAAGHFPIPMGGLSATAADRTTIRNTLAQYMQLAAGGVSVESSQYNINTLQLLTMGVGAVATATGTDYFPEVTAFLHQAGLAQLYELTPNFKDSYQWGDNEEPRNIRLLKRMDLLGLLAGVTQDDPNVGPYLNQLVHDLAAKYGTSGFNSAAPIYPWMFYTYNPYAAQADWQTALDAGLFAPGRGTLYFHNGWSANSSFFGAQFAPPTNADHELSAFGDFQLYGQGGWAVTHPIGYGAVADSGLAGNDMLIAGLSSMDDRHVDAQQFGPNGSYAYVAGTTSGSYYDPTSYYNPPPTFLQEWTRSLFYLPSVNGGPDTVIVYDRVNATDPRSLPNFSRYTDADEQTIQSAPALDQWIIHSNARPTITTDGFTWQAANGQQVQVTTLLPAEHAITTYTDKQILGPSNNFLAKELKGYQTRVSATGDSAWQTFLNVVQSGNQGTPFRDALVKADDDSAEGTLVHRTGQSDTLVLFGALQAGRVLEQGYTVQYVSATAQTQVNLTDLDPAKNWTVSINGGQAQSLTVSSQGVASFTAPGAGSASFTIAAG